MSEHASARNRSRRWLEAVAETLTRREAAEDPVSYAPEAEEYVPEVTEESPMEQPAVDHKSTTGYRLALGAVITLGVLILIGVSILIVGFVKGWGHHATTAATQADVTKPVSMSLAPGFRILSNDTQPGRLILHVRSDTQDEIDIIDLNDGHVIAQIHAPAPK